MVPARTGVIYGVEWGISSVTGNYAWGTPYVEYDRAELQLNGVSAAPGMPAGDVVVDAICVDFAHARLIFSTEHIAGRDELFVSQRSLPGQMQVAPKVLRDGNGIKVSDQLGLDADSDVDGTCGIDPEQVPGLSKGLGMPLDIPGGGVLDGPLSGGGGGGGLSVDAPLGLSINRTGASESGVITIDISGLGKEGVTPAGIIQVYMTDVSEPSGHLSGPGLQGPSVSTWALVHEGLTEAGGTRYTLSTPAPSGLSGERELALQAVHYKLIPSPSSPLGFVVSSPRASWVVGIGL
jgi:hypothetical protein